MEITILMYKATHKHVYPYMLETPYLFSALFTIKSSYFSFMLRDK